MLAQTEPKYREIYRHVYDGIRSGVYAAGERIPTEVVLGGRFNVSRITVARALRELQLGGWIERRRGAGSFVRGATPSGSRLIGVVSGEHTGAFPAVCEQLGRFAESVGLGVIFGPCPSANDDDIVAYSQDLAQRYIARRVAGVIFEPMVLPQGKMQLNVTIAEALRHVGIAVVLLDRDIYDYPARSAFDLVGIDNRCAGFTLTEHLLSTGCRRVHFICRPLAASTTTARAIGHQEALARFGFERKLSSVHQGNPDDPAWVRDLLQREKPDAFVCSNDLEAAGLLRTLSLLRIRVPQDVAVVGVNDDPYAKLLTPALTTMSLPCDEIVASAVQVLLNRLNDRTGAVQEVRLGCDLKVRESCGAALRDKPVAKRVVA